jgi:lambda family phage portal protein
VSRFRARAIARRASGVALQRFYGPGGYEAGRTDRAATRNWVPMGLSPDGAIVPDSDTLRARIHDLVRNAPLIAGAIDTHLFSTVGPGLIPYPRIDRKFLGLTDEQADKVQAQIARVFWAWAGGVNCDIRRRRNFGHLTWAAYRAWWDGGEMFVRRRFKRRPGDLLGLKIQLIEAERVSTPDNMRESDTLVQGIEMDEDGAPITAHVLNRHPGDPIGLPKEWLPQPFFGPVSGERMLLHVALLDRDGQTRGVSRLAPVIESVKQLTRYAGAELDAAVASSFIMAVLQTDDGSVNLGSMGTGANQPAVGFVGGAATASASRQIEMAPAAVPVIGRDEKLEAFNPQRPNSGFEPFFRAFCSIIGASIALPHELLIKHFTSSYSASRGALIEAWRGFKTFRSLIVVDQLTQPIYEWVVSEAVAQGLVDAPGFFDDPLVRAAYLGCTWAGPTMGQLNPGDEIAAAIKRVDLGVSTIEQETAEMTGGDWEENLAQRAKEERLRKQAGLTGETIAERIVTEPVKPVPADGAPADGAPPQDKRDDSETRDQELAHARR